MWLFFLFAAFPIVEIALFIIVGGWIGLWPTLGLVLLAGLAGTLLIRTQAARTAVSLHQTMTGLRNPSALIAEGAAVMVAAILLILPGFLSDMLAVCLLVPPIRRMILQSVMGRISVHSGTRPSAHGPGGASDLHRPDVIDGEFIDVTPNSRAPRRPSGWTQH